MGNTTKHYKSLLNLKEMKRNVLYGAYKDFEITLYIKSHAIAYISFYASDEFKLKLIDELKDIKDNGYIRYKSDNLGMEISTVGVTPSRAMKLLMPKIEKLLTRLHELMVKSNCIASGGYNLDGTEKIKIVNKRYITLNNKGIDLLVYKKEERARNINSFPPHYILGAIGIFLATVVSLLIWYTLDILNLFSPVACAFSVILGDLLYIKMGGRDNKYKLILLITIPLIITILTTFGAYLANATILANNDGLNVSGIEYLMTNYSLKALFISRMVLNPIFILVGFGLCCSSQYYKYMNHHIKISDLPENKRKEELPE